MSRVIEDGGTVEKYSAEALVYQFDYDAALAAGVELADAGAVVLEPTDGRLTFDHDALVSGNRKVQVRLLGGKVGKTYVIRHTVDTDENPAQTKRTVFALHIRPEPFTVV